MHVSTYYFVLYLSVSPACLTKYRTFVMPPFGIVSILDVYCLPITKRKDNYHAKCSVYPVTLHHNTHSGDPQNTKLTVCGHLSRYITLLAAQRTYFNLKNSMARAPMFIWMRILINRCYLSLAIHNSLIAILSMR